MYTQDHSRAATRKDELDEGQICLADTSFEIGGYIYRARIVLQPGTFPAGEVYGLPSNSHVRIDGPARDHPELVVDATILMQRPLRWTWDGIFQPIPLKKRLVEWLENEDIAKIAAFCHDVDNTNYDLRIARGKLRKQGQAIPETKDYFSHRIGIFFSEDATPKALSQFMRA